MVLDRHPPAGKALSPHFIIPNIAAPVLRNSAGSAMVHYQTDTMLTEERMMTMMVHASSCMIDHEYFSWHNAVL